MEKTYTITLTRGEMFRVLNELAARQADLMYGRNEKEYAAMVEAVAVKINGQFMAQDKED